MAATTTCDRRGTPRRRVRGSRPVQPRRQRRSDRGRSRRTKRRRRRECEDRRRACRHGGARGHRPRERRDPQVYGEVPSAPRRHVATGVGGEARPRCRHTATVQMLAARARRTRKRSSRLTERTPRTNSARPATQAKNTQQAWEVRPVRPLAHTAPQAHRCACVDPRGDVSGGAFVHDGWLGTEIMGEVESNSAGAKSARRRRRHRPASAEAPGEEAESASPDGS